MGFESRMSEPHEVSRELLRNLQQNLPDEGRLIILKTYKDEDHYVMRFFIRNPEEITEVLVNHALQVGEMERTLDLCEELIRIGSIAKQIIISESQKRAKSN